MPEKNNISAPTSGMMMDVNSLNLKENQYPYALNAAIESNSENGNFFSIQNEASTIKAVNFPEGYKVLKALPIHEQNRTIYFLVNSEGSSVIGEVINCSYADNSEDAVKYVCGDCVGVIPELTPLETTTNEAYCDFHTIIQSDCLGFNIDYPIRARYKITDCSLNVYFVDKLNQRRYIYFDYESDDRSPLLLQDQFKVVNSLDDCDEPVYSEELDCNKINYHPNFSIPYFKSIEVVQGGNLKAGTVQFIIAYSNENKSPLTEYFPASNPVPIFSKYITFETDYETDRAVKVTLDGLDKTFLYGYYNVVVAETVDSFTTFKNIGNFPVTQSSFIYTGNEEDATKLTADDIFFRKGYYKTAGNITDANQYLFYSDLEGFAAPNLQRAALNIKLNWQTVALRESSAYGKSRNTELFRGYMRDEVYAFGIEFITDLGEVYGTYHIPGPSKEYFSENYDIDVYETISNNDVITDPSCVGGVRNKRYQVYNTAIVVGTPHEYADDCGGNAVWEWGEFAYHESTKRYPNDQALFGDLCGQPIRHHKFPDSLVTHIHDSKNGSKTFIDSNVVYPIGVSVNHQSVIDALAQAVTDGQITEEDKNRIVAYRIVRGNRVGNKSVVAKGLLFDMWSYDKFDNKYYYANYPYNDLRPDDLISNDEDTYEGGQDSDPIPNTLTATGRYTFHSPETHFVNNEIGTELKLETLEYGQSEGFFNKADEQAKYKFLSTFAMTLALATGIAAAFSSQKEKKCKVVVSKSERWILPLTEGTNPGATITIPTPTPGAVQGDLTIFSPLSTFGYEELTGQPLIPHPFASEVEETSCKGSTFQLLNPLSGNPAGLFLAGAAQAVYLGVIGLKEMQIMIDLIKALIPLKNFGIQYNSAGKYVNYQDVANSGNKVRSLLRSAYLEPIVQLINEATTAAATTFTNVYINNWHRERSVYLKIDSDKLLSNPAVADTSRFTMDAANLEQEDLGKTVNATISSFYASIKNYVPDQYGNLSDIEYIPVGSTTFALNAAYGLNERGIFGGDTFISRFALKRKMPFFLQTRFRANNESDVTYSELGNVGFPNYYFNTERALLERLSGNTFGGEIWDNASDLLGVAQSRLDAKKNKAFYQSGFIHLYSYGIPYFFVESDINVDYRHGENNAEKDFYPHQQDLDNWLQERVVPISEDNYYFYNKTYSKQNKEEIVYPQVLKVNKDCKISYPSTIIQSEEDFRDNKVDNWLIFKANNLHHFPASNGRIIGLDGIENDKVLVRFENTTKIFGAYATLQTDEGDVAVGNGGVFNSRAKDFAVTSLGYAGTQHTAFLQTEFGHIWVDAKRGNIFNLGANASGLDELAKDGMGAWFKENLPFNILKDFPNFSLAGVDNNYKGIGIALSFDQRLKRFFLTKLDYKKLNPAIVYNSETKTFSLDGIDVSLTNPTYFCNKSWTISYSFLTKSWTSFHSFKPNYYVDHVDMVQSGLNGLTSSLWSHGLTDKSYQVYYGQLYPFIVEVTSTPMMLNSVLTSVEYMADTIRYYDDFNTFYSRLITFNKAIIYNENQTTGVLNLIPRDEEDLFSSIQYPKINNGNQEILVTRIGELWTFNQFWDVANSQTNNIPLFKTNCNNHEKEVNLQSVNYYKPDSMKQKIRGRQTKIRLINDLNSGYKFIYHFSNQKKSSY